MKLTALRAVLRTRDIEATIRFYTGMLGFTLAEYNHSWGWASLYKDEVSVMLAGTNEHIPFEAAAFTGSFYFNTDDVDALWLRLKDKVEICYEPETFEWGMKEFAIYDNNGYIL